MDIPKLLLLFWSFQGGIQSNSDTSYCADQLETLRVEEGGSVTIPCRFSFPKDWDESTEVRVYWREAQAIPCGQGKFIHNHTENWTDANYKGRIFVVGNPKESKTASIRIQWLKETDGPIFCCRVEIRNPNKQGGKVNGWQNRHGTFLMFPGHSRGYIEQLDAVSALHGENITIPCHVRYPPGTGGGSISKVTWTVGSRDLCNENTELLSINNRYNSWVSSPEDASLHIQKVLPYERKRYCCRVETNNGKFSSEHGTELVVGGSRSNPGFTVHQPHVSSAKEGDSVTINCTFTSPPGRDPMWVWIYWRVGSPRGPYAYHPSQEMVHSTYGGRTELRGQSDLHIQWVRGADNTSYYCLVLLRFCVGNNIFNSTISHGEGTSLIVTESSGVTLPIIISLTVLFVISILCGILIFLKIKGIICKTANSNMKEGRQPTADIQPWEQASTIHRDSANDGDAEIRREPEESGGVLYAQLQMNPLNKRSSERGVGAEPESDPQVLYAAVRRANPQDLYSSVQPRKRQDQ
ncbi:sialic acid-binding Ig-like lectin 10 isoform X2 [Ascaphus truei]|uniref:sialic acid-binding Ig-like lectin 10 isoform X2 n=1 Tax=Ascaphus truei TaxID=8439 RepID=UPI003F5A11D4